MTFVYTSWYIVLALLVVAIAGLVVAFIMMDKKDKQIIETFMKETNAQAEAQAQAQTAVSENVEEKKE